MSALFISHASSDAEAAREVAAHLERWGWSSLFLDLDPEHGIRAGVAWEAELYRRLKMARALIAVVSRAFLASRWCFAEVTQARALGKPVVPLRIEPCELGSLLADRQAVDLTAGEEEGWERLRRGLETISAATCRSTATAPTLASPPSSRATRASSSAARRSRPRCSTRSSGCAGGASRGWRWCSAPRAPASRPWSRPASCRA
jgi:hypothetical protein